VYLGQWNILSQLLNQKYETSLNMHIVIDMNKPNSLLTERDAGRVTSAHASFYRDETKRNEITFGECVDLSFTAEIAKKNISVKQHGCTYVRRK